MAFSPSWFYDWLEVYQDFDFPLPLVGPRAYQNINVETMEPGSIAQPSFSIEGSYCTSIQIRISGSRLTVSGNPSRIGRIDNLFGLTSLDDCFSVYNRILRAHGLPDFTRCTRIYHRQGEDGTKAEQVSDGAVIKQVHITTNRAVGQGNEIDYLKGLSTQSYRNSIPRLHANGMTADWLSKRGNANLLYPSVYSKAHELALHSLDKIKRAFGAESPEFRYLNRVISFCSINGVVRFEQKLKGRLLTKLGARFWGLFDPQCFQPLQEAFLSLDEKLKVTAMTFEGIAEKLINSGVVDNTRAANCTASYAFQWMHGSCFDLEKSQVQVHRARLRAIGIDIGRPCNLSTFSPVFVTKAKEITVSDLQIPDWYQPATVRPNLKLVA